MADLLTAPILTAALVLCAAGGAKLRRPAAAARALQAAGLDAGAGLIRTFAVGELALGCWSLLAPGRLVDAALGATYLVFAGLAAVLSRTDGAASCGCFGDREAPASLAQSALSAGLAALAGLAAVWPAHGLGWVLGRPPAIAATLLIGLCGAAYATIVAYTELPAAWSAWERT